MELTSEDADLLLIALENNHLKLKRERSGVHEINPLREQNGEYQHLFSQLKADRERFFFKFLEWILRRSRTFWGKLNTAWSIMGVTFINRRTFQKNVL
jgi:hypothetical protein